MFFQLSVVLKYYYNILVAVAARNGQAWFWRCEGWFWSCEGRLDGRGSGGIDEGWTSMVLESLSVSEGWTAVVMEL